MFLYNPTFKLFCWAIQIFEQSMKSSEYWSWFVDRISYPSPQGHFSTSQSVLKWVKLNQLSARLMAGGPCRAIVIPLFPVSGPREALSLYAWGGTKIRDGALLQSSWHRLLPGTSHKVHGHSSKLERESLTHSLTHSLTKFLYHSSWCIYWDVDK